MECEHCWLKAVGILLFVIVGLAMGWMSAQGPCRDYRVYHMLYSRPQWSHRR